MSDRTHGSVRTDSRAGDGGAAKGTPTDGKPAPTQSIPATGSQRAQAPGTGSAPVVPQPLTPATGATPAQQGAAPQGTAPQGAPPQDTPKQAPSDDGDAPAGGPESGAGPMGVGVGSARTGRGKAGRGPRRARLQVRHIDTWSALKISLMLSIALFFIWMVAVGLLYMVLGGLGVFEAVNDLFGQIGSASGAESTGDVVTLGVVFWGAAVIGAINVVLLTALCTVGTFIYNLCSDLVGGLEVTLSERD
ncbi:Transmembrane protein of unknown function [Blastococcus sp. DSM 46786]|uniref:DUF3566 domain-containing protein n=1 Tax=Blastococcus sp. DSM 46786 TaxID=1798227 RepID=UPI0008B89C49|nr:DUF3566 domain-containing protein [Blastococcus sp. DSM 46786]SEL25610.1 Transmembrane protein of unknown function [Blastococcus sp. DSM 46786]